MFESPESFRKLEERIKRLQIPSSPSFLFAEDEKCLLRYLIVAAESRSDSVLTDARDSNPKALFSGLISFCESKPNHQVTVMGKSTKFPLYM